MTIIKLGKELWMLKNLKRQQQVSLKHLIILATFYQALIPSVFILPVAKFHVTKRKPDAIQKTKRTVLTEYHSTIFGYFKLQSVRFELWTLRTMYILKIGDRVEYLCMYDGECRENFN